MTPIERAGAAAAEKLRSMLGGVTLDESAYSEALIGEEIARVVLQASREPSGDPMNGEGMVYAGGLCVPLDDPYDRGECAREVWQAMIDRALSE